MEKKIKNRPKTRQNLSNPHYNLSEKELLKQRNKNSKEEYEVKELDNGRIILVPKTSKS